MKQKIYFCGNELVEQDAMPVLILPYLKEVLPEVEFLPFDPSENFPDDATIYIIDTVLGLDDVAVIEDLEKLEDSPRVSVHDSDLGFHLKWMQKLGKLPKIVIFGVPAVAQRAAPADVQRAARDLRALGESLARKIKEFIPI